MPLTVVLSNTAGSPIYKQIAQQVRDAVLEGRVEAGEMLPSIRALARDLRVSVITTTRAYSDLVAEGILANVPGKGYFALPRDSELVREQVLREVEGHLDRAAERARLAGLSSQDLHTMLDTVMAASHEPGGASGAVPGAAAGTGPGGQVERIPDQEPGHDPGQVPGGRSQAEPVNPTPEESQ